MRGRYPVFVQMANVFSESQMPLEFVKNDE